jgi:signal peptidase II
LDFHIAGYHWPAFNVADSGIMIGAIILIVDSLFTKQKINDPETASGEASDKPVEKT